MAAREPQTITKKELVNRIAESSKQTKVVVKEIVQQFLNEIVLTKDHPEGTTIQETGNAGEQPDQGITGRNSSRTMGRARSTRRAL